MGRGVPRVSIDSGAEDEDVRKNVEWDSIDGGDGGGRDLGAMLAAVTCRAVCEVGSTMDDISLVGWIEEMIRLKSGSQERERHRSSYMRPSTSPLRARTEAEKAMLPQWFSR